VDVQVHRAAIWILGEYATSADDIRAVVDKVKQTLGPVPIVDDEMRRAAPSSDAADGNAAGAAPAASPASVVTRVTADGTYATQSVFSASVSSVAKKEDRPPLRRSTALHPTRLCAQFRLD